MSGRQLLYRAWKRCRRDDTWKLYRNYASGLDAGIPPGTLEAQVRVLLEHARLRVPYYSERIPQLQGRDPLDVLSAVPLLSKDSLRRDARRLTSSDISTRKWRFNTSGGSTGEPVRLIQDRQYAARTAAITLLYAHLVGREVGQPEVLLWGSEREILQSAADPAARLRAWVTNSETVNAFRMTESAMRDFIAGINRRPPQLLIAYAQALYEVARFVERAGLEVRSQRAIMTSAGTLHSFMRETIERVFKCPVYNRYGSREVGNIGCQVPGSDALWIAPWGSYVEVVNPDGTAASAGVEGEIVVTCLSNFAMPLIRYRIGDRGVLLPPGSGLHGGSTQSLVRVTGRTVDAFRLRDGTLVDGEYFTHLLYFCDWVKRFQVVQDDYDHLRIAVSLRAAVPQGEETRIISCVRAAMGDLCRVDFEYVDDIPLSPSGKRRYTISMVAGD